MQIRPAQREDVPQLMKLYIDCLHDEDQDFTWTGYPQPLAIEDWVDVTGTYLQSGGQILVAEAGQTILGYIKYRIEPKIIETPVNVAEMYVKKKFRSGPAGGRLMKEAYRDIRTWNKDNPAMPVTHIEVSCRPSERQIERWQRKGFEPWAMLMQKEF